jgi:hypothetical protein
VLVLADIKLRLLKDHQPRLLTFPPPLVVHDSKRYGESARQPLSSGATGRPGQYRTCRRPTRPIPCPLPEIIVIRKAQVVRPSNRRCVLGVERVIGEMIREDVHGCTAASHRGRLEETDGGGESDDPRAEDDDGAGVGGVVVRRW